MKRSNNQYLFVNGQWRDTWNDLTDDQPLDYGNDVGWAEALLDICGCWMPEQIVVAMHDYLQRVAAPGVVAMRYDTPHELADYLLATMADGLELTEHDGSVAGAWLTDEGRRWLVLAERDATST